MTTTARATQNAQAGASHLPRARPGSGRVTVSVAVGAADGASCCIQRLVTTERRALTRRVRACEMLSFREHSTDPLGDLVDCAAPSAGQRDERCIAARPSGGSTQ